eukprot:3105783-Heterocapsa_arctica.AAC.1
MLPYPCMLDGCMYGLRCDAGYLRKPWRVQTNMVELREPLSRTCNYAHTHVTTRGRAAERTAYYAPELVRCIGLALGRATALAWPPV